MALSAAIKRMVNNLPAFPPKASFKLGDFLNDSVMPMQASLGVLSLTYGNPVTLDFTPTLALYREVTLAGDLTIAFSNLAAACPVTLFITADGSQRNLTFPSGVVWLGIVPTTLAAGKVLGVSFVSRGTTAARVVASANAQL